MPALNEADLITHPRLSREHEELVMTTFHQLMADHAGGDAGLVPAGYDAEEYPEQRLDVVGLHRHLADIDTVRALAQSAYKHSPDIEAQFLEHPDLLNNIIIDIKAGRDINAIYDHPSIINIAIGGACLRGALFTFAHEELGTDLGELNEDMIISKGVTDLLAFGSLPAARVLTNVWTTYFSIPPSRKVRGSGIPEKTRKDFNAAMLEIYEGQSATPTDTAEEDDAESQQEGTMHTLAGSGAGDISIKSGVIGRKKTVHMGPLAHGTIKRMMGARNIGIGLTLGDREPVLTVGRLQNPIRRPEEGHGIMAGIALRNSQATGDEYFYHPTRESLDAALQRR